VTGATSRQLSKYGFAGKANTPSAYLTGLLVGSAAKSKGVAQCVADLGRHAATKGGLLYAAVKGVLDAGVSVPIDEEVIPAAERMEGKHAKTAKGFAQAKEKILSANKGAAK
jgi:large subunit ribosomal protein L18